MTHLHLMYKRPGHLNRSVPVHFHCLNCYSQPLQLEFTLALTETLMVICNRLWDIGCPSVKLFLLNCTDTQVLPVVSNTVWVSSLIPFPLESPARRDQMMSRTLCHLTLTITPQPPPQTTPTDPYILLEIVNLAKNIKFKTSKWTYSKTKWIAERWGYFWYFDYSSFMLHYGRHFYICPQGSLKQKH